MDTLKELLFKYKHGFLVLAYFSIYLPWFAWLEDEVIWNYKIISMDIDRHIPFCEVFIIPYLMWFFYLAAVIIYFIFTNKTDYYKLCAFLFTGMTLFLIISTLWPNGHHLRPLAMPRDNIFIDMVQGLYRTDTATNLWPSIHVYNSLGAHIAIAHSQKFENRKGIRLASLILCSSIVMSTVFLKQHSMFDVITAIILALIMYFLVYRCDVIRAIQTLFIKFKYKRKPQTN